MKEQNTKTAFSSRQGRTTSIDKSPIQYRKSIMRNHITTHLNHLSIFRHWACSTLPTLSMTQKMKHSIVGCNRKKKKNGDKGFNSEAVLQIINKATSTTCYLRGYRLLISVASYSLKEPTISLLLFCLRDYFYQFIFYISCILRWIGNYYLIHKQFVLIAVLKSKA